jgi:Secretion system C-terminal sorting domain
MDGRGSCSSVADSNGNLILYSAVLGYLNTDWNTRIFNSQNQILQNCDSITGEAWYNENITIPRPNHHNQFFTFSVGLDAPNNQGCFYSISDMNLNFGQGGVVKQNIKINNATSGDCLTAIKHGNGSDWWVLNKYSKVNPPNNHFNRFFVYRVTGDSIYAPITQNFNDATDAGFQKIIWHPSYNKFMLINPAGYMTEFNFDRCTGLITLDRNIFPEQTSNYDRRFWEGAYSASGNLFYVSTTGVFITDTLFLFQYDLNSLDIPLSCDTLERFIHPIGPGALRLAPDNKIYFGRAYETGFFGYPYKDSVRNYINENLSVINYPDSLGAACSYVPFSFYLGGKRTYYGLPNNPYYDLGPLVGSPCDTITSVKKVSPNSYITKFFPNPTTSGVTVYCSNKFSESSKLEIYNSIGVLIHSIKLPINENYYTFSLENLISGIYNCKISSPQETRQIEKLVIIR